MSANDSLTTFKQQISEFASRSHEFSILLDTNRLIIASASVNDLFKSLAEALLQPQLTCDIIITFRKYVLTILHIAMDNVSNREQFDYNCHIQNSIILAKVAGLHPDVEHFVFNYFEKYPAPFEDDLEAISKKKRKTSFTYSDLDIVDTSYALLKFSVEYFRKKWNWSVFVEKFIRHEDLRIKWNACKCIALLTGMNENSLEALFSTNQLQENHTNEFSLEQEKLITTIKTKLNNELTNSTIQTDINPQNEYLISISGIYLPIYNRNEIQKTDIIQVESTKNNLRRIALAVASNKAVCLQGPVGAGKTCLVEYLAHATGRVLGESFVKVQLGDQTDSKMLLGSYRCTDVPGEFIWQPGVLTQAVLEGSWLLLEDIDAASADIASVLTSLLETSSITVPGFRDNVHVSPSFQLFTTQRLISTITGLHKKHSNSFSLLQKQLLEVTIEPLTPTELSYIISTSFPALATIAERMVNVYLLFTKQNQDFQPKSRRLISTRDLFKWCQRAIINFDVSKESSALRLLQDAIDIFCCSYSNVGDCVRLARDIASQLGIANDKANYFLSTYKAQMGMTTERLTVGRASVKRLGITYGRETKFFPTRPSVNLLERTACCVNMKEPVLFVGETGTGKTTCVQYLADALGHKLIVINMNQQSDSADLLGGFKPVDMKFVIQPVRKEFEDLFRGFFNVDKNKKFLENLIKCFDKQKWKDLVELMKKSTSAALHRITQKKHSNVKESYERWMKLNEKLVKLELQVKHKSAMTFAFVEGSLIKAIENGYWVLLDEINLANAETLECLSGLLEGKDNSLSLLERGDKKPVKRHPDFTLFACMNPSTDVGKKDLPAGLRNRFTEFYVDELTEKNDLMLLVSNYLKFSSLKENSLEKIVTFYLNVRKMAEQTLVDDLGHRPNFTLRSLCRALVVASKNPCGVFTRSLYEAFCVSFLTQLDSKSYTAVEALIGKYIIGSPKEINSILKAPIPQPNNNVLEFEGYWIGKGQLEVEKPENYVLTPSVRKNLKDLVRVVSIGKLPVLLQGETSVGKTSLITFLAKSTGNKCVRINNHEHTDLQEYIGSYVADTHGRLVFREGLLVEAMRKGHWIILDELNLAPTDVLEALNRVLDDNRELFVPETQETVKASPSFMLFATQNPPGAYGGRKMLSRAFRNRFVELHFQEIPPPELEVILQKRCQMPLSYAKKMVAVMKELQVRRRGSAAFAGKQGFITLRDLFRWGERYRLAEDQKSYYDWDQHIADEGFLVLSARVRKPEEKIVIIEAMQKILKRSVKPEDLFTLSEKTSPVTRRILEEIDSKKHIFKDLVWTYNMRQNAVMIKKAQQFKEPVLLVGDTGGGKTTICKVLAAMNNQELSTVNCHMHTESSDFIGSLRPVRDHSGDLNRLFEWVDGPLIKAMKLGHMFLVDEISLADDSVLERLNSLLEPERSLLIAEKGSDINNPENSELITAHKNFHFIGTMNPGGDFGKKELSPALRNRFTEIWCEACTSREDLIAIIERQLENTIPKIISECIMDFVEWLRTTRVGQRLTISIRDILTWVTFLNVCVKHLIISEAYLHGACLTFLDGLGSGSTGNDSLQNVSVFRQNCVDFINTQLSKHNLQQVEMEVDLNVQVMGKIFGIHPFFVEMGESKTLDADFSFDSPTTAYNTMRLLRGMQLRKAILLEGSPGVGKTSLVSALAKSTGNKLFRVNLSDQTDISDLFGADLPVEGGTGGQFSWRDGPLLRALKQGHWILLDELNLASQSVLEGLNACLDHRGEIFIPELGKTFLVKQGTRFFACQNPLKQGGSRRGLPQSFLNRFIQVYISALSENDYLTILQNQFPSLPAQTLKSMIDFNSKISHESEHHSFIKGSPWEFNLRDIVRWCQATIYNYDNNPDSEKTYHPENLVNLIYVERMRTKEDRKKMAEVFKSVFGCDMGGTKPVLYVNKRKVLIGDVEYTKDATGINSHVLMKENDCLVLRKQLSSLRTLMYCVNLNWMSILVGSAGSGKSSLVKTLANLTQQTLKIFPVTSAMDTTDILGGFEQTDYARHLEDIHRSVEELVLRRLQELFVYNEVQNAIDLMRTWESSNALQGKTADNINEQTSLFLKKLRCFQNVLKNVPESKNTEEKITNLINVVERDVSLGTGGKFEWVDSILVKCLQEGSWLLIDNVNLCSPAVLDRLNGLLEPNGVLTIGERGVDEEGKMIEIKPHPNFRLFLTMDPKNGEISRAMRNRGLEIYLTNLAEDFTASDFDIKSLIELQGLCNNKHINVLLKIHQEISNEVLVEKPNIQQLLDCSFLISQQLIRGFPLFEAFKNAIKDVYNNYIQETTNLNFLLEQTMKSEDLTKDFYTTEITLNAKKLHSNTTLEKIKQQSSILTKFLQPSNEQMIHKLLILIFSLTSEEDFNLRNLYLKDLNISSINDILSKVYPKLKSLMCDGICDLPQDRRWLPDCLVPYSNDYVANRLFLLIFVVGKYELCKFTRPNSDMKKIVTMWEYVWKVREGKIENSISDVLICEMLDLMEEYDKFLAKIIHSENLKITDKQLIELLSLVQWRFHFAKAAQCQIYKINYGAFRQIIANLQIHYKWLLKHGIVQIEQITTFKRSEQLDKILNAINFVKVSALGKIGKRFQNSNSKPAPCTDEKQLMLSNQLLESLRRFDLYDRRGDFNCVVKCLSNEVRFDFIEAKRGMMRNFEEDSEMALKKVSDGLKSLDVDECEVNLLPLLDHLLNVFLRKIKNNFGCNDYNEDVIKKAATFPVVLCAGILEYKNSLNASLLHEITYETFNYLNNSAAVNPTKFLDFGRQPEDNKNDVKLTTFAPVTTYLTCNLLVNSFGSSSTPLGNYRNISTQRKSINVLLWKNIEQLSSEKYDFIKTEISYLNTTYVSFLKLLLKSLGSEASSEEYQTLSDLCIEEIHCFCQKAAIDRNTGDQVTIFTFLNDCAAKITQLNSGNMENALRVVGLISEVYMLISYLKAYFNSKVPVIDPVKKVALKKDYCRFEIEEMSELKECFELQNQVYSGNLETMHPLWVEVDGNLDRLQKKLDEFNKFVAVRSSEASYELVTKEISLIFAHILSLPTISRMFYNFRISTSKLCSKSPIKPEFLRQIKHGLAKYCSSLISCENFLHQLSNHRADFPDIVLVLMANISEFLYGLRMQLDVIKALLEKRTVGMEAEVCLEKLLRFPVLNDVCDDYLKVVYFYFGSEFAGVVKGALGEDVLVQENFKLMKCGIQEVFNLCVLQGNASVKIEKRVFDAYNTLLKYFVKSWTKQEAEEDEKRKAQESLYKMKTHCKTKTEEEQITEELNQMFPNFNDFNEFQQTSLDNDVTDSTGESEFKAVLKAEDLKFVVDLHVLVMTKYVTTEWIANKNAKGKIAPNFLSPLLQKFQLFKSLLEKTVGTVSYKLDAEVIGSLVLMANVAQNYKSGETTEEERSPSHQTTKTPKDFYKDQNVEEVLESYHILENLRIKIQNLLAEWPEHPTLKTIIALIERMYSFSITSPISRFLMGFEILLGKCKEWEEVAHSGISILEHTTKITQQIIVWRKMELNMWRDSLNNTFDRMNDQIPKWWTYLYRVMMEFIQEKQIEVQDLIELLQKFVTLSSFAEYEKRVQLLYVFHCHATLLKKSTARDTFVTILWNVYNYFLQFQPAVNAKIKELRAPIEKKMKEYIKIVTWKDINYWAIKEVLGKTHRNLHKFIREFRQALSQPVTPLLSGSSIKENKNIGIWDRPQRHIPKEYHYRLDSTTYMAKLKLNKMFEDKYQSQTGSVLNKTEKYFLKARKLCQTTVETAQYPELLKSLDGFVANVIDAMNDLEKLQVDTTLPIKKQQASAKFIHRQKQRALAEFFKVLSDIGISYRKGLVESRRNNDIEMYLMEPIDLEAAFSHLNYSKQGQEKILIIWDNCEMFYNRCLVRLDVLQTALKNPSKDLGIQNVERCKGIAFHLMDYIKVLKKNLVGTSRELYVIKYYTKQFEKFCCGSEYLHRSVLEELKSCAENSLVTILQSKLIMESCPEDDRIDSNLLYIPVLEKGNDFVGLKNEESWIKAMSHLNDLESSLETVCGLLEKARDEVPSINQSLQNMSFKAIDKKVIVDRIRCINSKMDDLLVLLGNTVIARSFKWLRSEWKKLELKITEEIDETPEVNSVSHETKLSKLVRQIMLIIQGMFKKYSEKQTIKVEELDCKYALLENHISESIVKNLDKDLEDLKLTQISKLLNVISKSIFKINPQNFPEMQKMVSTTIPLLNQLILLYEYFMTQQVAAYRVTSKLTSIVLNIFIELASKGFCLPPELSEEGESESGGKQSNGMGLGDGEGEKDVSDRIESEDQLDDAEPAGKEKEDKEDPDCKEEDGGIEMSEDFDSKLQDKKENEEDEGDSETEADEQMGETEEGAEALDKQIWGSDEEEDEEENETENKEQKEESGNKGEDIGEEEQMAAKNDETGPPEEDSKTGEEKSKKDDKEINDMDEKEFDDEQTDPYHGNQDEYPEPEAMDLPEDLEMNEDGEDEENQEENPFDIDKQKEDFNEQPEAEPQEESEDKDDKDNEDRNSGEEADDGPDVQDGDEEDTGESETNADKDKSSKEDKEIDETAEDDEDKECQSGNDEIASAQEDIQAMDVDESTAADNVQSSDAQNESNNERTEKFEEKSKDKQGSGQSEMEENVSGHAGEADNKVTQLHQLETSQKRQKRRKPGESDEKRSLGQTNEPVKKKLKSVKADTNRIEEKPTNQEQEADMYQHIAEAKETDRTQILDAANEEQVKEQMKEAAKPEEDSEEIPKESSDELPMEEDEDVEVTDVKKQLPEKVSEEESEKRKKLSQHPEGEVLEEMQDVTVEGEMVTTLTVSRGAETFYQTQFDQAGELGSLGLTDQEMHKLRLEVQKQLAHWQERPPDDEAQKTWQKITSVTASLAQDLSEQLRLVLEPTQASRLKGDFRTGRRINMRKVIPYIASQFRKDKIWLRRTKPSKRDYQIVLAIDDSSSMADNQSKELTFESVALISKALTLLESGQLSVLSFGETTEVIHRLGDPFTEKSGSDLLQKFKFAQTKTCVANLVNFATEMLSTHSNTTSLNAKLLVIISDGRLSSDNGTSLMQAVRRAKLSNVFMVFVIVDNPKNTNSILDIRKAVFTGEKCELEPYMDSFPFPFYIILKDIEGLPNVLSDALRQWFEIVSNVEG